MIIKEKPFYPVKEQTFRMDGKFWNVSRLLFLAKDLEVMDVPIAHLGVRYLYDGMKLRELVGHMRAALDADLSFPVILDEDGEVMDGRHRIMKAILEGKETVKAVRFETNPDPDGDVPE